MSSFFKIIFLSLLTYSQMFVAQTYSDIDTTKFTDFHLYEPGLLDALNFGSAGSVQKELVFDQKIIHNRESVLFKTQIEELPSYDLKVPLLDAKYISGSNNEQLFSVFHSQNLSSRFNYAILYTKKSYDGYYTNQGTNHNFFQSNITYYSKDKRNKIKFFYNHQRLFYNQNGGIQNDSSFINDVFSSRNRLLFDVNLENAFLKDAFNKVGINQNYLLISKSDSLLNKTDHYIDIDISLISQNRTYFDSLQDQFYSYSFYDTLSTRDTLSKKFVNTDFTYSINKQIDSLSAFSFSFGLLGQLYTHKNLAIDTIFHNLSSSLSFGYNTSNFNLLLNGNYFISGYRNGNFDFSVLGSKKLNSVSIDLGAQYSSSSPSFELLKYNGNHSNWNNEFLNQNILSLNSSIVFNKLKLSCNYYDIENPIFFDYLANPVQADGFAQVIQSAISYDLEFKNLKLKSTLNYQYQGGYTIYQLPDWVGIFDLSYSFNAFKSALKLNIGFQGKIYSDFTLMDYRPDLDVFFVSNQKLQNSNVMSDFYLNAKIKTVNFFFTVSHFNAGFSGYNYFTALHYPSPDRYFKLGLRWMFLN
jgi:hypothetical protein